MIRLWGAMAGLVALPLCMRYFYWLGMMLIPQYLNTIPSGAAPSLTPTAVLSMSINQDGRILGILLGVLTASLWMDRRSRKRCLLGTLLSGLVLVGFLRGFWLTYTTTFAQTHRPWQAWQATLREVVAYCPLLLWALALIFFALLMRHHHDVASRTGKAV